LKYEKQLLKVPGCSLHLPQFLSFLVTGKSYSETTSIGCHTMLWNFQTNNYHEWVHKENIIKRLAPVFPSDEVIIMNDGVKAGVGLHDSSSALIPYLAHFSQPFILISTGTWCISLNPFNNAPLTFRELEQDCLCFMTYKSRPVKASRLFAGFEHEEQTKRIATHFSKQHNYFEQVKFNRETIEYLNMHMLQDTNNESTPGISDFRYRDLDLFKSYEEAYHQLMLDIVHQQVLSTKLLMKGEPVTRIFVDGGFSKNVLYMNLLAISFPEIEVYAASVAQASAMGAALAIHHHWNQQTLPADLIELKYYSSPIDSPAKFVP
jgi:sugar (pentulose or hexulose) kinase